jgi:integrase
VAQLAKHYHRSPALLSEPDLRQYFLYLINEKKVSSSTTTIALCGVKFLYEKTLRRDWPTLPLIRPAHEKKLPVVLSRDEVRRLLSEVQVTVYRACLTTIYCCGLRLQEAARLRVGDVDSARMMLHIHQAKGNKDRYVPLPERTLELLRSQWRTHRSPEWMFPSPHFDDNSRPVTPTSLGSALRGALHRSGITKHVHIHSLRHYVPSRTISRTSEKILIYAVSG